jgi:hypothetical protein
LNNQCNGEELPQNAKKSTEFLELHAKWNFWTSFSFASCWNGEIPFPFPSPSPFSSIGFKNSWLMDSTTNVHRFFTSHSIKNLKEL